MTSTGLPPRLAASLAYAGWWATALLFLTIERRDAFVRFHAAQSLATFGPLALAIVVSGAAGVLSLIVVPPAAAPCFLAAAFGLALSAGLWIVAIWQAARGQVWHVPLAGRVADRIVASSQWPVVSGQ